MMIQLDRYPETDLPFEFPAQLEMRLQTPDLLEEMHEQSEENSFLCKWTHRALQLTCKEYLDIPDLSGAADIGARVYEVVSCLAQP